MRSRIIGVMEKSLSAYSDEHIISFFNDVKENGFTAHAFPRLTSNIGILISHGRRIDLIPLFIEMMDFCCDYIPKNKAGNDFSVRELIACINEIEKSNAIVSLVVDGWKKKLAAIVPENCYTVYAVTPEDTVHNWALFTAVSEFFRQKAGLCDSGEFIDMQLASQFKRIDGDGLYMDGKEDVHHPMLYEVAARGLFALLLSGGYRGKHYHKIDSFLKTAGLLTLKMQSPTGEIAFGGRSNQFIMNEPWLMATLEYEAKRYKEENPELAARFKAASERALAVTEAMLSKEPIKHTKNRFPTETRYGCDKYADFNKYMITVASNIYAAYLICDESISYTKKTDTEPSVGKTSEHFHKLFLKSGGYGVEFDLNADPHYDASGLGRVHRAGAPSAICLSAPCPKEPVYTLDGTKFFAFSLCSALKENNEYKFAADGCKYTVLNTAEKAESAEASLLCAFDNGISVNEFYSVSSDGVSIYLECDGEIGFALPAFYFDGEEYTEISESKNSLTVTYGGWQCRYTTDGEIIILNKTAKNRNGYYKAYLASAKSRLNIKIQIIKNDAKM